MLDLKNCLWYYMQAVAKRQQMSTDVDRGSLKIEQKEIRQNNSYFEKFLSKSLKYIIRTLKNSHKHDKTQIQRNSLEQLSLRTRL